MRKQVAQMSTIVSNLQRDKATLRNENAKLQAEVSIIEKKDASQKQEAAKIEGLLHVIDSEIKAGEAKAAKRRSAAKHDNNKPLDGKIDALSQLVKEDFRKIKEQQATASEAATR